MSAGVAAIGATRSTSLIPSWRSRTKLIAPNARPNCWRMSTIAAGAYQSVIRCVPGTASCTSALNGCDRMLGSTPDSCWTSVRIVDTVCASELTVATSSWPPR